MLSRRAIPVLLLWAAVLPVGLPRVRGESSAESLTPILKKYCFRCHGSRKQEAGLNFATMITQAPLIRNGEEWTRVISVLERKVMPPEDKDQPSDEQRQLVRRVLDQSINHFDYSTVDDPGFVVARRLTHAEYNHTIRDLFGADLRPADRFPAELAGETGFDNSANTLFLQAALMERYIAAAERVVELALPAEQISADPASTAPLSTASLLAASLLEEQRRSRDLIFVARPI